MSWERVVGVCCGHMERTVSNRRKAHRQVSDDYRNNYYYASSLRHPDRQTDGLADRDMRSLGIVLSGAERKLHMSQQSARY